MTSYQRGRKGEALAREFLVKAGYSTVAARWRSRFGEIDLIVRDRKFIVFVEVKLRKNSHFAYAREYVSKNKQDKIKTTASLWLSCHSTALQPRFDVIEVYLPDETSAPLINHIKNAF